MTEVAREQVLALRLARHHLAERLARGSKRALADEAATLAPWRGAERAELTGVWPLKVTGAAPTTGR